MCICLMQEPLTCDEAVFLIVELMMLLLLLCALAAAACSHQQAPFTSLLRSPPHNTQDRAEMSHDHGAVFISSMN